MRGELDTEIERLATVQHGVVSRVQLRALGLGVKAVEYRVRTGRLWALHRGVYAVGHRSLSRDGRCLAAALACGAGAALSHRTAAQVWGLRRTGAAVIDISVASTGGRTAPRGVRLYRRRAPFEATTVGALSVTTVAQTILDLATVLPQRALERALEEAEARHLDTTGLSTVLAAHPHRRGAPRLRAALERHGAGGTTLTRSELEERFLELCEARGLPRPAVNTHVEGHEVDFAWRKDRVVVETDGFRHHRTRAAFERDRRRDAVLVAAGWRVLRFTHERVLTDPAGVARDLAAVLTPR